MHSANTLYQNRTLIIKTPAGTYISEFSQQLSHHGGILRKQHQTLLKGTENQQEGRHSYPINIFTDNHLSHGMPQQQQQ